MELTISVELENADPKDGKSIYRVALPGLGVPSFAIRANDIDSACDALNSFIYNELDSVGEIDGDD